MVWHDTAPTQAAIELQAKIQRGCYDGCGWSGDEALVLRMVPPAHENRFGKGWAVLHAAPGQTPVVVLPASPIPSHQIIVALQQARRNWEDRNLLIKTLEAHDAQVDKENAQKEAEIYTDLAQGVRRHLRKQGRI